MPIIEFDCPECGAAFEELLGHPDEPTVCPDCGSATVTRRLSVFSSASGSSGKDGTPPAGASRTRPPAPT